jgi:hypothetical protein
MPEQGFMVLTEIIFVVAVVDSVQMVMYTNAKSMEEKTQNYKT